MQPRPPSHSWSCLCTQPRHRVHTAPACAEAAALDGLRAELARAAAAVEDVEAQLAEAQGRASAAAEQVGRGHACPGDHLLGRACAGRWALFERCLSLTGCQGLALRCHGCAHLLRGRPPSPTRRSPRRPSASARRWQRRSSAAPRAARRRGWRRWSRRAPRRGSARTTSAGGAARLLGRCCGPAGFPGKVAPRPAAAPGGARAVQCAGSCLCCARDASARLHIVIPRTPLHDRARRRIKDLGTLPSEAFEKYRGKGAKVRRTPLAEHPGSSLHQRGAPSARLPAASAQSHPSAHDAPRRSGRRSCTSRWPRCRRTWGSTATSTKRCGLVAAVARGGHVHPARDMCWCR